LTLDTDKLVAAGFVEPGRLEEIRRVAEEFAVALTPDVTALIDPSDPADPIAAQFIPSAAELVTTPDDRPDPIGDERWSPVPGIVHRYADRVLLKPILLCPVYCRFCFRREVVGKRPAMLDRAALERAFDYIRERPEIWEVIVTGGDPFVLAPRRLAAIVRTLDQIPHVAVIRFHTRVPLVDPGRVKPALARALAE
jgi:lysine 2,3-aminomutase